MAKIIFKTLEYKNFKAVGNTAIKIILNAHKTTLLSGANGAGKSTAISALCFGLFGRGYGEGTKPSLLNTINMKQLLVTLEFSIGAKEYKIVRGMKPGIFEIYEDAKLINQDPTIRDYQKVLEQQILKFNYRAFTQVVVVGGGDDYTPFMKLSAKDRREFVEDLLDIRIFTTMNSLLKDDTKLMKEDLKELESQLKAKKEKVALQDSFIKKMKKEKSESSDKIMNTIYALKEANKDLMIGIDVYITELELLTKDVELSGDMDTEMTELRMAARQLQSHVTKKREKASFYSELETCPTCAQDVADAHKEVIIKNVMEEIGVIISEIDTLEQKEMSIKASMIALNDNILAYSKIQKSIASMQAEIAGNNQSIKNANSQIEGMQEDTSSIDDEMAKMKLFAKEYMSLDAQKKEFLETKQYQELSQQMLSDSGIKSKIIKTYIPKINKLINKYLAELDFFVSFHLDENFNETIKSRHRDTFTYSYFSEGQKRRIDLAILLAWVEIAKDKNALHVNIAFLDEIDAPLDASGSDMLHSVLKACSSENIFLVSHKGDLLADKVDNIIAFRLHNNFTEQVID